MRKYGSIAVLALAVLLTGCESAPTTKPAETTTATSAPEETEPATYDLTIDEGATPLESFTYEILDDHAVIKDFVGKETKVVITSHIGSIPVTEIGQYAFEAAWDVQSIQIPETVTFIGEQAFADCESLTSINIPAGVTTLYRATFASCLSLETLTIPATVTETYEELLVACPLTDLYVENPTLDYVSWGLEELEVPCTIHAPAGAKILTWAESNGFPIVAVGEEPAVEGTEEITEED